MANNSEYIKKARNVLLAGALGLLGGSALASISGASHESQPTAIPDVDSRSATLTDAVTSDGRQDAKTNWMFIDAINTPADPHNPIDLYACIEYTGNNGESVVGFAVSNIPRTALLSMKNDVNKASGPGSWNIGPVDFVFGPDLYTATNQHSVNTNTPGLTNYIHMSIAAREPGGGGHYKIQDTPYFHPNHLTTCD